MLRNICLVQGWGINDTGKTTSYHVITNGVSVRKRCPYYNDWGKMLQRCFDFKLHKRQPTYKDCTIHEEWKYLSNFIKWVDSQPNRDWQNCSLDKDFLVEGNKHYGPDTCVYMPQKLNAFVISCRKARGSLMIGVSPNNNINRPFKAQCRNPFTHKKEGLGLFPTELEAHLAWKARKHELACQLADIQSDERVAKRLREMYSTETDWTNK